MPSDDREKQFERGLARHLRGGSGDAACPDAEILAAYQERTLSPEELEQWKKHIVGCARCQETLALLESSEAALKEEWQEVLEPAQPRVVTMPAQSAAGTILGAAGGASRATEMKGAAAAKVGARRPTILRWVAPVGAIAAVLVLWLGLRHFGGTSHAPADSQMAMNRSTRQELSQDEPKAADEGRAAAMAPKKTTPLANESALEKDAVSKPAPPALRTPGLEAPRGSVGVYPELNGAIAREELDKKLRDDMEAKKTSRPNIPQHGGVGFGAGAGTVSATPAAPAPPPVVAGDAVSANAVNSKANADASSPALAKPPATARARENKAKEEMPHSVTQTVEVTAAAPTVDTSSASQVVTVESVRNLPVNGRNLTQLTALAPGVANVIVAPKGKHGWRVGAAGSIEHTNDDGKTWKAQKSGVTADLISGSAPSEKICWVAGKAGTLLLTTDGGKHWKALSTPLKDDLARVQATDALRATIWSAGDRAAYGTEDGGLSWAPAGGSK